MKYLPFLILGLSAVLLIIFYGILIFSELPAEKKLLGIGAGVLIFFVISELCDALMDWILKK